MLRLNFVETEFRLKLLEGVGMLAFCINYNGKTRIVFDISWVASSEKLSLNMRRIRPSCACAKYLTGL